MANSVLLPMSYLGNIDYYRHLIKADQVTLEGEEWFVKQSYRSRTSIYGANGKLDLVVPVVRIKRSRQRMKDIRIVYDHSWQRLHWKSFESAYRRSPYFEYYEDDFQPLFKEKYEFLHELTDAFQQWALSKLGVEKSWNWTETFEANPTGITDLRKAFNPKAADQPTDLAEARYMQTFESKCGFIPNLSIADLLFNQGPAASAYLDALS